MGKFLFVYILHIFLSLTPNNTERPVIHTLINVVLFVSNLQDTVSVSVLFLFVRVKSLTNHAPPRPLGGSLCL